MTTPYDQYKARTGAAGDRLRTALRRNPDDVVAWDAHAAELKAARSDLVRCAPGTATQMLNAALDFVAQRSTPPRPDDRTDEERAADARFLG